MFRGARELSTVGTALKQHLPNYAPTNWCDHYSCLTALLHLRRLYSDDDYPEL
jgi:hypothetical protein